MKTSNLKFFSLLVIALLVIPIVSCSSDDDLFANITLNEGVTSDAGGDFTGNGGNSSRTIMWTNSLATADYNADITSTATGTFQMTVTDATGVIVLERGLNGAIEPDSFSGVTDPGEPGVWSITITISSFKGDGSYSLSAGN